MPRPISKTVLITGATGLVGKKIVALLHKNNYNVHYLTSSKSKIETTKIYKGFYWDYKTNTIDNRAFEGVATIIHLAGATIAKRWTSSYKREIIDSRVQSAALLFSSLSKIKHNVVQFISASAIGIYLNSLTNNYTEDTVTVDDSFIGKVVNEWESAVNKFKALHLKVTIVRIGLVLAKDEGALPKLTKPISLYLGSPLGSGKQLQSWIHLDDLTHIFYFLLQHKLEGVYNAVAPYPETNSTLTYQIAKHLKKAIILPHVPQFVLQLILGEMSYLLLSSQNVSSSKIQESGYKFQYRTLNEALNSLL